jgi:hypothetical protein
MTTTNLITKLNKMNINHSIIDINGFNQDIKFIINGMVFKAGFTTQSNIIEDFCREISFDKVNQEMQRRFFDNFNKCLKYATI